MDLTEAYKLASSDLAKFGQVVERTIATTSDVHARQRLEAILPELRKAVANMDKLVPPAIAELSRRHGNNLKAIEKMKAGLNAVKQKAGELGPKPTADVPATPSIAEDPHLPMRVRDSFLKHFSDSATKASAPADDGEVAGMESTAWQPRQEALLRKPPRPAPPKARPAPSNSDVEDVSDMTSGSWEPHVKPKD